MWFSLIATNTHDLLFWESIFTGENILWGACGNVSTGEANHLVSDLWKTMTKKLLKNNLEKGLQTERFPHSIATFLEKSPLLSLLYIWTLRRPSF